MTCSERIAPKKGVASREENNTRTCVISNDHGSSSFCQDHYEQYCEVPNVGTGPVRGSVSVPLGSAVALTIGCKESNSTFGATRRDLLSSSFTRESDCSPAQELSQDDRIQKATICGDDETVSEMQDSEVEINQEKTLEVRPEPGPCRDSQKRPQLAQDDHLTKNKRVKFDGSHPAELSAHTEIESPQVDGTSKWDTSEDLPLMANVEEVLVTHYILDLSVDFEAKVMSGSIVLFLEPASNEVTNRQFQLCLDSTLVNIESVREITLPEKFEVSWKQVRQQHSQQQ